MRERRKVHSQDLNNVFSMNIYIFFLGGGVGGLDSPSWLRPSTVEVPPLHSDTPHSVELLWTTKSNKEIK